MNPGHPRIKQMPYQLYCRSSPERFTLQSTTNPSSAPFPSPSWNADVIEGTGAAFLSHEVQGVWSWPSGCGETVCPAVRAARPAHTWTRKGKRLKSGSDTGGGTREVIGTNLRDGLDRTKGHSRADERRLKGSVTGRGCQRGPETLQTTPGGAQRAWDKPTRCLLSCDLLRGQGPPQPCPPMLHHPRRYGVQDTILASSACQEGFLTNT